MGGNKQFSLWSMVLVAHCFVAVAQAGEANKATTLTVQAIPMETCLLNAGLGNMQAIKNMAQKFGPEAVLDMMFSSVNPVFQSALLTKSLDNSVKPVKSIEDMRENKYFQHAIATTAATAPWVKVTADGRFIHSPPAQSELGAAGWTRIPLSFPKGGDKAEQKAANLPATVSPLRY